MSEIKIICLGVLWRRWLFVSVHQYSFATGDLVNPDHAVVNLIETICLFNSYTWF